VIVLGYTSTKLLSKHIKSSNLKICELAARGPHVVNVDFFLRDQMEFNSMFSELSI